MSLTRDVQKDSNGVDGHLTGKNAEQIYRAHHNLDDNGKQLPGSTPAPHGCECDHCQEYLTKKAG